MSTILTIIMVIAGIILVGSVLLMSPKGGLGLGLGGVSNAGEYGSKKTIESTLKKVALITSIIFVVSALILPYTINR